MTRNLLNAQTNQLAQLKSSTSNLADETEQICNETAELQGKARDWKTAANVLISRTDNVENVISNLQNQNLRFSDANNQLRIHLQNLSNRTSALEASASTLFNRTDNLLRHVDFTRRLAENLQAQTIVNDNNTFEALSRKYRLHFFMIGFAVFVWPVRKKNILLKDEIVFTKMIV